MNKNLIIGVLSALLVLASLWGQVGTQGKKTMIRDKKEAVAALSEVREDAQQQVNKLLVDNEQLQKNLVEVTAQHETARHELVGLRKSNKVFEAKIAKYNATIATMKEDRQKLASTARQIKKDLAEKITKQNRQITALQKQLATVEGKVQKAATQAKKAAAQAKKAATQAKTPVPISKEQQQLEMAQGMLKKQHAKLQKTVAFVKKQQGQLQQAQGQIQGLQKKIAAAEKAAEKQAQVAAEFESLRAQVIGLGKIVEEKNTALAKTNKELNNWKVNMNVLLGRIADQQDALQQQQEQNRNLVKELATKNKELVQVNEQLMRTPVKQ